MARKNTIALKLRAYCVVVVTLLTPALNLCVAYPIRMALLTTCILLLLLTAGGRTAANLTFTTQVTPRAILVDDQRNHCYSFKVQDGEYFSELLSARNISTKDIPQLRKANKAFVATLPKRQRATAPKIPDFLYSEDQLRVCVGAPNKEDIMSMQSIAYTHKNTPGIFHEYKWDDKDKRFVVAQYTHEVLYRVQSVHFVIKNSLYADALRAGLSENIIMSYVDIFQWDIDFVRDVHAGDQVGIMFEQEYKGSAPTGNYRILIAEYVNKNKTYISYRYERDGKLIGYFDANGKAKKRRFLRWPLNFTRISSQFNPRRFHPILKKVRPHKGVDYAAPRHTKIYAVSHGRVIKAGWAEGYGRRVIIDHGNGYTTLYGHLQKINTRVGAQVSQGQVIGTVGSSGWATGPHLHYEFRVRGVYKNPVTVSLPGQPPIPKKYKGDFKQFTAPLQHRYTLSMQDAPDS